MGSMAPYFRIKYDVEDGADQRRYHSKSRTSVRTDDRVHRLAEHIKRDTGSDPEEVILCVPEGLFINRTSEHGEDRIREDEIQDHDQDPACQRKDHGISDSRCRITIPFTPEKDRHISTGTISNHDGHGKRDDRKRKNDGVGRISVRSEIAGIGDKDLIDDIIKGCHQKRNDAGDGIHPHQFCDRFLFKISICVFQCRKPPFC